MRFRIWALIAILLLVPAAFAATPGETSAPQLAPLRVTSIDRATGKMNLVYQNGCGSTNNTIYYGSLGQGATTAWTGDVCDVGTSGSVNGFNPGSGSYFFVIVGNDGRQEGSYGRSQTATASTERAPFAANTCGQVQNLADACVPSAVGASCASNRDCGARTMCVANATGGGQCGCLEPFTGSHCESCAPGYAGPDCKECAAGFVSNEAQNIDDLETAVDRADPEVFRCVPDVPGDCTGRSCNGRGVCVVAERDAICQCDPGFTGTDCEDCLPNYERNAGGVCVLGSTCGAAKCGGHGTCMAASFGDVVCQCDAGYSGADCGGPALTIKTTSETLTLYDAQSLVLQPQGGVAPYSWAVTEGPARIDNCDPRTDPTCPFGGAKLTIVAPSGGIPELTIVKVTMNDGVGLQTAINLMALPSSYLPFTGAIKTELVPYYQAMLKYMRARGIRAGVLGISKGGVILGTNGYGYRDSGIDNDAYVNAGENGPLVQPDSPFRIASITKTLTAAAVRQAALDIGVNITSNAPPARAANWVNQAMGFNLAGAVPPPFDYNLPNPNNLPNPTTDPLWSTVTIQHLLNHHVGFWRDQALPSTNGYPAYNSQRLPFTVDPDDPQNPNSYQFAFNGTSNDISYTTMYQLAAFQLAGDPRPTVGRSIMFAAGNKFQYSPGGNQKPGDNYANIGYQLAGRVLEGLKGEHYNPNDPSVPEGWGQYPKLLQRFLCENAGINTGVYPGENYNPQPTEPYYRHLDVHGHEQRSWDLARGADAIRFNDQAQVWEFCEGNCPNGQNAVWDIYPNAPSAYGSMWLAQRNSAGGIVATTSALLKFARNYRVKVGTPNEGAGGIGTRLQVPGSYGSSSSHNGALPGTRSWLWQMGKNRRNYLPLNSGAWKSDPMAAQDLDDDDFVVISEDLKEESYCYLPSDVAVAVVFAQSEDRRAPTVMMVSPESTSNNSKVYTRIADFLADATCKVKTQGWPQFGEPPAQLQVQPNCN